MNRSKTVLFLMGLTLFGACSTTPTPKVKVISTNTDLMQIGTEKPQDVGPFLVQDGNVCVKVFKTWRKIANIHDQTVWGAETSYISPVSCQ